MRIGLRIAGSGGQGAIVAGEVLGRAASISGLYAAQMRSYGAEARGTLAYSDVVISSERIAYPILEVLDVLVAMNRESAEAFVGLVREQGLLIKDDTFQVVAPKVKVKSIPALAIADGLGSQAYINMVFLGYLAKAMKALPLSSLEESVKLTLKGKNEQNIKALRKGYELP